MGTESTHPVTEFERLLTPLLPLAYRIAVQYARNPADAEDMVQEAALLAHRGFHTFERGSNFKAWFLRVLTNVRITTYRRTRRAGAIVPLDDGEPRRGPGERYGETPVGEDPAIGYAERLDGAAVDAAIQSLPSEYRTVAILYLVDDLSYRQIAEIVGCPVGTVRSRLHRGRRLLRQALRPLAIERGWTPEPAAA